MVRVEVVVVMIVVDVLIVVDEIFDHVMRLCVCGDMPAVGLVVQAYL